MYCVGISFVEMIGGCLLLRRFAVGTLQSCDRGHQGGQGDENTHGENSNNVIPVTSLCLQFSGDTHVKYSVLRTFQTSRGWREWS